MLAFAGVLGLTALVAMAGTDFETGPWRLRAGLAALTLLEIAAGAAVFVLVAHRMSHWPDCG